MLKNSPTQLEMFQIDDQTIASGRNFSKKDSSQLKKIRDYQKMILFLIAFIFVSLVSFSLGIEKGKKLIVEVKPKIIDSEQSFSRKTANAAIPIDEQQISAIRKSTSSKKIEREIKKEESKKAVYTVQVASLLQNKNVNKELSKLKNKGYGAFSLVKGKFIVICIGKFNAEEEAQSYLQKLKNKYPDCRIRRL